MVVYATLILLLIRRKLSEIQCDALFDVPACARKENTWLSGEDFLRGDFTKTKNGPCRWVTASKNKELSAVSQTLEKSLVELT